MQGIGYMTGAELICAVTEADPGNALPPMSVAVAITVARNKWTDADTQKYGEKYRDVIFKWARDLGEIPRPARADENEVCQYRKRLLRKHTLDQIQECGIKSDGWFDRSGRYNVESEERWKELGPVLLDLVCDCGKGLREHTRKKIFACGRKDKT